MTIRLLLVLTLLMLSIGCGSDEPRVQTPAVRAPESIQTAFVEDVVPLMNGSAYAIGEDGLWYLSGSSAVRVRPLGDSAARADFASAILLEVQPTADGGAYAFEFAGRIWRLDADSAVVVKETGTVPADTMTTPLAAGSAGWLLYTRERRLRGSDAEDAEAEFEAPEDYDPAEQWP